MTDSRCCDDDDESRRLNPDMRNPFEEGVARRRMLQASAAGTATAMAGCTSDDESEDGAPTIFVFNTGDRTVSVVDAESDELVDSTFIGTTASFPANQYGTSADSGYDTLWLNVDGGVAAVDQRTLDVVAEVETGYGPNYPNVTPDEEHLVVSSGGGLSMDPEPDSDDEGHAYFRVDADRDSDEFGEITEEIEVEYDGPCDVTIGPDGEYAYSVDVANETLTVLRIDPFEIAARVDVGESTVEDGDVLPFMCTATFDGDLLFVENGEGELGPEGEREGSESIWDISDPENPEEVTKITREDGLPSPPITSEIGPDNDVAYLFTPGSGNVTVVDVEAGEVETTIDVGGASLAAAWGPHREKLYVPVQSEDQVAVIDHDSGELSTTIDVGEAPVGAVGGMVRPESDAMGSIQGALASLGMKVGEMEATYCYPDCYCGFE